MNSLEDPKISSHLVQLHAAAKRDIRVFARAIPAMLVGLAKGRSVQESVKPYLKDTFSQSALHKGSRCTSSPVR